MISKNKLERKKEFKFFNFRICDEDEEIPLHQRIQRSRPALYPNSITEDTKPQSVYDIDE